MARDVLRYGHGLDDEVYSSFFIHAYLSWYELESRLYIDRCTDFSNVR